MEKETRSTSFHTKVGSAIGQKSARLCEQLGPHMILLQDGEEPTGTQPTHAADTLSPYGISARRQVEQESSGKEDDNDNDDDGDNPNGCNNGGCDVFRY